jgi:SsrA-binding protein
MAGTKEKRQPGQVAVNREAYHDYFVEESIEAGVILTGTEIKSIRNGRMNLRGAFARISKEGEVWIEGMHIALYEQGTYLNHEPMRQRKLLLHRRQINNLVGKIQNKGLALVPLRLYFKGNLAKIELGICRGKKLYDKREDVAKRDAQRDIARVVRRG